MARSWGSLGYLERLQELAVYGRGVAGVSHLFPVPWANKEAEADDGLRRLGRIIRAIQPRRAHYKFPYDRWRTGPSLKAQLAKDDYRVRAGPIDRDRLMAPGEGLVAAVDNWPTPFVRDNPLRQADVNHVTG